MFKMFWKIGLVMVLCLALLCGCAVTPAGSSSEAENQTPTDFSSSENLPSVFKHTTLGRLGYIDADNQLRFSPRTLLDSEKARELECAPAPEYLVDGYNLDLLVYPDGTWEPFTLYEETLSPSDYPAVQIRMEVAEKTLAVWAKKKIAAAGPSSAGRENPLWMLTTEGDYYYGFHFISPNVKYGCGRAVLLEDGRAGVIKIASPDSSYHLSYQALLYGTCNLKMINNPEWRNLTQVSAPYDLPFLFALREDGTVLARYYGTEEENSAGWQIGEFRPNTVLLIPNSYYALTADGVLYSLLTREGASKNAVMYIPLNTNQIVKYGTSDDLFCCVLDDGTVVFPTTENGAPIYNLENNTPNGIDSNSLWFFSRENVNVLP